MMTGMATGIWRSRCASCVAGFLILWPCAREIHLQLRAHVFMSGEAFSRAQQEHVTCQAL